MMKKFILKILLAVVLFIVAYFIYCVCWISKYNRCQEKMEVGIPENFQKEMPILRTPNGYFYLAAVVNKSYKDTFIIDTKATCLSRAYRLNKKKAQYWGIFPMPSANTYGQMSFLKVYNYNDISICGCDLNNPLFKCIPKTNGMYDQLFKDVIGKNVLERFKWKFDLDKGVLTVFSKKIKESSLGITKYKKLKNGIRDKGVILSSPYFSEECKFSMDLGYEGDVLINKEIFASLEKKQKYTKYLSYRMKNSIDTAYEFRNVPMTISGMKVPSSTIIYYPGNKRNLIGARFMERFNFALSYQGSQADNDDLFIQARENFHPILSGFCPDIGCDMRYRNGKCCITILKIDGMSQKMGVRIGDEVVSIDNHSVDLSEKSVQSGAVSLYLSDKKSVSIEIIRNGCHQIITIK